MLYSIDFRFVKHQALELLDRLTLWPVLKDLYFAAAQKQ